MTRPSSATPSSRTRRRLLGVAAAMALVVAAVVAVTTSTGSSEAPSTAVAYDPDARTLEFTAEGFDGRQFDSAALRGTPLVVNFYASWCTICDRELPDFQTVSQRLAGRVAVVGVNPQSNDSDEAQAAMIARSGVTYPTLRDPSDELLRQFNTTGGLPTTLFVDADGVVRKVHNGLLTEQQLLQQIASSFGVQD